MITEDPTVETIHGYCALCISRCGSIARVENGRFIALEPDPTHPTGQALCAKGRAGPELVYHPERLTHPLRRTRPKGDPDPGWERIEWDEALNLTAAAMRRIVERHGPKAVAFSISSPSTTAIGDSTGFIQRLMNAFGTRMPLPRSTFAAGAAPTRLDIPMALAASARAAAVPCRISR